MRIYSPIRTAHQGARLKMRIKEITDQYGRDLYGKLECEHCGTVEKLTGGYDDDYWHNHVLPARHCGKCGKNRAGAEKAA